MPCGIARLLCQTWTLTALAVISHGVIMFWTLPVEGKKKGENSRVGRFYKLYHAHYKVKHPDGYISVSIIKALPPIV
ncbi:hypothetical protein DFH11DRAFT_1646043 [Phellopilus nigrolimitatus]|nr:hypothetical protein DFH11DRAFT_1646043 [Phellopilus nigrolimitatus]